jgi:hypothetical protein
MTEAVWIIGGAILMGSLIIGSAIERSRAKDYHFQLDKIRDELEQIKFSLDRVASVVAALLPRSQDNRDPNSWWNKTFGDQPISAEQDDTPKP